MTDEKPKPIDDLKQGLGLLFRAARGAVEKLPTDKIEEAVKDGAKEVGKAFESIGSEIDKAWNRATGSPGSPGAPPAGAPPPAPPTNASAAPPAEGGPPPKEPRYDDGYAPEPPKGPRVG